jgi:hypothetical protein
LVKETAPPTISVLPVPWAGSSVTTMLCVPVAGASNPHCSMRTFPVGVASFMASICVRLCTPL